MSLYPLSIVSLYRHCFISLYSVHCPPSTVYQWVSRVHTRSFFSFHQRCISPDQKCQLTVVASVGKALVSSFSRPKELSGGELSRSSQSLWIASTWQRMQMQLALKYDQREGGRGKEQTREKDNRARGLKPHPEAEHGLTTLWSDRLLYHTADHQVHQSIHLTTKCTRAHQSEQTCPLWFNAELD